MPDFTLRQALEISGDSGDAPGHGYAVAVSSDGSTMLVGAPGDDPYTGPSEPVGEALFIHGNTGAAYVFVFDPELGVAGEWVQQAKLIPVDYEGRPFFGSDVALSADGNTALVGAPEDSRGEPIFDLDTEELIGHDLMGGAIFVFVRDEFGGWTQQARLTPDDHMRVQHFGLSVALSADGNVAVACDQASDTGVHAQTGFVIVFRRNEEGVWEAEAELFPSDPDYAASFNPSFTTTGPSFTSVAIDADGTTILVTGPATDAGGSFWTFVYVAGDWVQFGEGVAPEHTGGFVGESVQGLAVSGDGQTMFVSIDESSSNPNGWIYNRTEAGWDLQAILIPAGVDPGPASSCAFSYDGNVALIGIYYADLYSGTAVVYRRTAGVWEQDPIGFVIEGLSASDQFGWVVALTNDGTLALIGAPGSAVGVGAAYIYEAVTVAALSVSLDGILIPLHAP